MICMVVQNPATVQTMGADQPSLEAQNFGMAAACLLVCRPVSDKRTALGVKEPFTILKTFDAVCCFHKIY